MNNKINLKETMYTYSRGEYENEYIREINEFFVDYNNQIEKMELLNNSIHLIRYEANIPIPEESKLREDYNTFYVTEGSLISYESYKQSVLDEVERSRSANQVDLSRKLEEYNANLYYLGNIKDKIKGKLVRKKIELENELDVCKLNLKNIRVLGYGTNFEQFSYDDLVHKIRKIEYAIEKINELIKKMDLTKEEIALFMGGLNPREKEYYEILLTASNVKEATENENDIENENIDENENDIENENIDENDYDIENENIDENENDIENENVDENENDIENENVDENDIENENIDENDYDIVLADYKERLEIYKNKVSEFEQAKESYELGRISENQYKVATKIILMEYGSINKKYDIIKVLYEDEIKKGNSVEAPEEPIKPNTKEKQIANDYDAVLANYKGFLKGYKNRLAQFEQLKEDFKTGAITKEDYDNVENVISEEYEKINDAYKSIKALYDEEINKGNSVEVPEVPEKPNYYKKEKIEKKRFNKTLVLRTLASIAAGVGLGATVWFSANALGALTVGVLGYTAAATVANVVINKRLKPKAKTLEQLKIESIKPANNKLKEAARKVKNYFKSKEGLGDISRVLTSSVLTTSVVGLAKLISDFIPNAEPILIESIVNDDNAKFGGFWAKDASGQVVTSSTVKGGINK